MVIYMVATMGGPWDVCELRPTVFATSSVQLDFERDENISKELVLGPS